MANDITSNPLVFDTLATAITQNSYKVSMIRWVGGTTAQAALLMNYGATKVHWSAPTLDVNKRVVQTNFDPPVTFTGLSAVLTGGTIYVYLAGPFTT